MACGVLAHVLMKTCFFLAVLAFALVSSTSAQVTITTYGGGLPPRYTTIAPTYGSLQPAQGEVRIPRNLVTPLAPLDFSGVLNSYQKSYQDSVNANAQRQATEYVRKQTRLVEQRSRMEAEQYQKDIEVRQQDREADLAEAQLRKELAEARLAELRTKRAEEKAHQDEAERIRSQEAQRRFDRITAEIQKEAEDAKAKQKAKEQNTATKEETK